MRQTIIVTCAQTVAVTSALSFSSLAQSPRCMICYRLGWQLFVFIIDERQKYSFVCQVRNRGFVVILIYVLQPGIIREFLKPGENQE